MKPATKYERCWIQGVDVQSLSVHRTTYSQHPISSAFLLLRSVIIPSVRSFQSSLYLCNKGYLRIRGRDDAHVLRPLWRRLRALRLLPYSAFSAYRDECLSGVVWDVPFLCVSCIVLQLYSCIVLALPLYNLVIVQFPKGCPTRINLRLIIFGFVRIRTID